MIHAKKSLGKATGDNAVMFKVEGATAQRQNVSCKATRASMLHVDSALFEPFDNAISVSTRDQHEGDANYLWGTFQLVVKKIHNKDTCAKLTGGPEVSCKCPDVLQFQMATNTVFGNKRWDGLWVEIDAPQVEGDRSHAASVHGMGTQNMCLGLAGVEGDVVAVRRVPPACCCDEAVRLDSLELKLWGATIDCRGGDEAICAQAAVLHNWGRLGYDGAQYENVLGYLAPNSEKKPAKGVLPKPSELEHSAKGLRDVVEGTALWAPRANPAVQGKPLINWMREMDQSVCEVAEASGARCKDTPRTIDILRHHPMVYFAANDVCETMQIVAEGDVDAMQVWVAGAWVDVAELIRERQLPWTSKISAYEQELIEAAPDDAEEGSVPKERPQYCLGVQGKFVKHDDPTAWDRLLAQEKVKQMNWGPSYATGADGCVLSVKGEAPPDAVDEARLPPTDSLTEAAWLLKDGHRDGFWKLYGPSDQLICECDAKGTPEEWFTNPTPQLKAMCRSMIDYTDGLRSNGVTQELKAFPSRLRAMLGLLPADPLLPEDDARVQMIMRNLPVIWQKNKQGTENGRPKMAKDLLMSVRPGVKQALVTKLTATQALSLCKKRVHQQGPWVIALLTDVISANLERVANVTQELVDIYGNEERARLQAAAEEEEAAEVSTTGTRQSGRQLARDIEVAGDSDEARKALAEKQKKKEKAQALAANQRRGLHVVPDQAGYVKIMGSRGQKHAKTPWKVLKRADVEAQLRAGAFVIDTEGHPTKAKPQMFVGGALGRVGDEIVDAPDAVVAANRTAAEAAAAAEAAPPPGQDAEMSEAIVLSQPESYKLSGNGKYAYQLAPDMPKEFVDRLLAGYYDVELRDHDAVLHTLDGAFKVGRADETALHLEIKRDNGTTRYYELRVVPCVSVHMKEPMAMKSLTEYVDSRSTSKKHAKCYRVTVFPNMLHYKSMGQYSDNLTPQERVMAVIGGAMTNGRGKDSVGFIRGLVNAYMLEACPAAKGETAYRSSYEAVLMGRILIGDVRKAVAPLAEPATGSASASVLEDALGATGGSGGVPASSAPHLQPVGSCTINSAPYDPSRPTPVVLPAGLSEIRRGERSPGAPAKPPTKPPARKRPQSPGALGLGAALAQAPAHADPRHLWCQRRLRGGPGALQRRRHLSATNTSNACGSVDQRTPPHVCAWYFCLFCALARVKSVVLPSVF